MLPKGLAVIMGPNGASWQAFQPKFNHCGRPRHLLLTGPFGGCAASRK